MIWLILEHESKTNMLVKVTASVKSNKVISKQIATPPYDGS